MIKAKVSISENKSSKGRINNKSIHSTPRYDQFAGHAMPADIQTEFISIPASLTVREALEMIQNRRRKAVVIRRLLNHAPLFYLYLSTEMALILADKNPDEMIESALDLHEGNSAATISMAFAKKELEKGIHGRTVVTDNGMVVGYAGLIQDMAAKKDTFRGLQAKMSDTFAIQASMDVVDTPKMSSRRGGSSKSAPAGKAVTTKAPKPSAPPAAASKKPSTAPVAPVSKPLCHFAAQMPEEVVAGIIQQIQTTISREEIDLAIGEASQKGQVPLPALADQKITVRLIPKQNFEVIGDSRADINAPLPGEPAVTLFFDVKPSACGEGELWIAFCQGPVSLVTLKLKPQIVATKSANGAEDIQALTSVTPPSGQPARMNTMWVYLGENNGKIRYRYCLWLDELGIDQQYESPEFSGDIMTVLKPYMNLFDAVETGNQADFDQLQIQMRSIGAKLFQTLFPKDLQRVFWDNRDKITHLKFYCEEPYIPWELLHVCEPGKPLPAETRFLGQMGLVRWLHGHTAPTQLRVRKGRAWYITPSYPGNELESAKKEGKLLQNLFGAKPVKPATRPEVTKLLGVEGPFDLFHFAGHGEASEAQITECRIELEAAGTNANSMLRDLTPDIVSGLCQLKAQDGTRPIVVLNSCRAGKMGYQLTGLGGFAPAFLEREAGVFIGALWMIGDEPALTFITAFYEALRDGKMVAQAVNAGREKAYQSGDATYLAYVVYADPFAHLV